MGRYQPTGKACLRPRAVIDKVRCAISKVNTRIAFVTADAILNTCIVHNQPMTSIRISRPDDGERSIEIWRHAVDATHHFLSQEDRQAIDAMVCSFLPQVPLWLSAA